MVCAAMSCVCSAALSLTQSLSRKTEADRERPAGKGFNAIKKNGGYPGGKRAHAAVKKKGKTSERSGSGWAERVRVEGICTNCTMIGATMGGGVGDS